MEFPGGPGLGPYAFTVKGRIQSLVRELRSRKIHCVAKKKKKKKKMSLDLCDIKKHMQEIHLYFILSNNSLL